jgi:small-conductance mechanosensitive channel
MSSRTYTEDELKEAIALALAPLQAELEKVQASEEAQAVAAMIAEAVSPKDAEIADLQKALDTATYRADTAEKQYDELVAFLDSERQAAEEAAELAARREARLAAVKESASFSDEYVEGAIDRWTAMADEDFNALLDDWKAVTAAKSESKSEDVQTLPTATAMQASRDETDAGSVRRELLKLTRVGVKLGSL